MTTLSIVGSLNKTAFDALLGGFRLQQPPACLAMVGVDLSGCTFVEAPAAAMLCALVYTVTQGQGVVSVEKPGSGDVDRYVARCGLLAALGQGGVGVRAGELQAAGDYVLPICRVVDERDVASIGEFVYRSVLESLCASAAFAGRARSVFDALCENIVVHAEAGAGGWAAAQVHRRRDGRRFLRIGVIDVGVGIPTTIARRYAEFADGSSATACAAILWATEAGISGAAESGGIGLTQVRQLVHDCRGTLHVRSLNGHVTMGIHGVDREHVAHFPGAQLNAILVE